MKIVNNFEELYDAIMSIPHPSVECVDNGIGNYEYWGSKGVDHKYEWEIEGDTAYIKVDFEDDDIEFYVDDVVYEAQDKLYRALNRYADEDYDYSDVVKLNYKIENVNGNTIITFEWMEA